MNEDETRNEIAAELRKQAAYESGSLGEWWQRLQDIALGEVDFPKPDTLFERLADLIDRPMCLMDLTETMRTDCGDVHVWECDRCGQECEEVNGSYEFCPHCGAEVVRE